MTKFKLFISTLSCAFLLSFIRINASPIDTAGLGAMINEYFNDFYKVLVYVVAAVALFFIGKDVLKYITADEDEKEFKELTKKVGKKLGAAIFVLILPQILRLLRIV